MAERKRSRHTAGADLTGRGAELPVGAEVGRCRHPVAAEGHTRRRKARAALGGSSQVEVAAGTGSGDTRNSSCFRLLYKKKQKRIKHSCLLCAAKHIEPGGPMILSFMGQCRWRVLRRRGSAVDRRRYS